MTKQERIERDKIKFAALKAYDEACAGGARFLAGIDEAGRGPLAGPVVAGCVVTGNEFYVPGVDDSKKLSEKRREKLFDKIIAESPAYGIGSADHDVIDAVNILEAAKIAMKEAFRKADAMLFERYSRHIELTLVDAVRLDLGGCRVTAVVHGDGLSLSIAAASILAKVYRDRLMRKYDSIYPGYGFCSNKGYPTKAHYEAIKENGITPIHRLSFLKNIRTKYD